MEEESAYTGLEIDALREVGSIGGLHASTAMANLVKKDVMVEVSECFVAKAETIPKRFGDMEEVVVGIYLDAYGKAKGCMMMILPVRMAVRLSDMLTGGSHSEPWILDEEDYSALAEIGNICSSAYLNAISRITGDVMMPSPPGVAVGMLGAILQYPATLVAEMSEYIVAIRTEFTIEDTRYPGFMLYIPDPISQREILLRLGVA